jgi:hypothetical protein
VTCQRRGLLSQKSTQATPVAAVTTPANCVPVWASAFACKAVCGGPLSYHQCGAALSLSDSPFRSDHLSKQKKDLSAVWRHCEALQPTDILPLNNACIGSEWLHTPRATVRCGAFLLRPGVR